MTHGTRLVMTESPGTSSLQALIELVDTSAALSKRKAAMVNKTVTQHVQYWGELFGGHVEIIVTFDCRPESEKDS